ncbi:hypothetical protein TEA_000955 [Camellia sinensis var. sinensis]|uniref:Uncharacterized protein n=1 Tax=Camellia sinensis var. sinensis TaxID=542762 RepID=A0A4V3WR73_CAMSN|nr:hypothetical protein TEA_000955 [Camellia sinensis var. sinensis]
MASDNKPHAVCIPYPAQSHIKGMLKLTKLLHHRGFYITFVNTEFNQNRLTKAQGPDSLNGFPNFQFKTIPDSLPPSNPNTTQDVIALSADELRIPVAVFWTFSACAFMGFYQFRALLDKGLAPLKEDRGNAKGEKVYEQHVEDTKDIFFQCDWKAAVEKLGHTPECDFFKNSPLVFIPPYMQTYAAAVQQKLIEAVKVASVAEASAPQSMNNTPLPVISEEASPSNDQAKPGADLGLDSGAEDAVDVTKEDIAALNTLVEISIKRDRLTEQLAKKAAAEKLGHTPECDFFKNSPLVFIPPYMQTYVTAVQQKLIEAVKVASVAEASALQSMNNTPLPVISEEASPSNDQAKPGADLGLDSGAEDAVDVTKEDIAALKYE